MWEPTEYGVKFFTLSNLMKKAVTFYSISLAVNYHAYLGWGLVDRYQFSVLVRIFKTPSFTNAFNFEKRKTIVNKETINLQTLL